ncbi:MAG: preprotein translocase subunit SecE [Solirubrobacteraceae bacterium]
MSRDRRQRESKRRSRRASEGALAPEDELDPGDELDPQDARNPEDARSLEDALDPGDVRNPQGGSPQGGFVRRGLPAAISGEVDEFDAALVRGAGGVPSPLDDEELERESGGAPDELEEDAGVAQPAGNGGGGNRRGRDVLREDAFGGGEERGAGLPERRERSRRPERRQPLPSRAAAFGRASWAELQRVQWPDREQVFQATFVVLGFVAVAGIYLFAADWVAEHVIKAIL